MIDLFGEVKHPAADLNLVAKAQGTRLLDVFLIGPLMMWGGVKANGALGATLFVFGVATIIFNGNNYLEIEKLRKS